MYFTGLVIRPSKGGAGAERETTPVQISVRRVAQTHISPRARRPMYTQAVWRFAGAPGTHTADEASA